VAEELSFLKKKLFDSWLDSVQARVKLGLTTAEGYCSGPKQQNSRTVAPSPVTIGCHSQDCPNYDQSVQF